MDTALDKNLEQRLAEVAAREEEVGKRERAVAAGGIRQNIYDRVAISGRSLDVIIAVCALSIIALTVFGSWLGRGQ